MMEVQLRGELTQKIQIMVPPLLVQRIDDWRFANRMTTRAKAMRALLSLALDLDREGALETGISGSGTETK